MPHDANVDETDRLVAAALQVNGRASWGEIARVLDLPERTVARRGQALFDRGLVRVSTYVDIARVLHARAILLRIKTRPGQLWNVARALARRPDASSVSILEGSYDMAGMFLPKDEHAIRRLLFEDLPGDDGIESLNATTVLRFYRSGHDWRPGILREDQIASLGTLEAGRADPSDTISEGEDEMIQRLLSDGRMSVAQLSRELGISVATTRRRMDSLARRGLMHPRTEVVPQVFGLRLEALVWMRAPMARLDAIGEALARAPEVKFIAATTGTSQLLANILVADEDAFHAFLTGPAIADPVGLEVVESLVVITPLLRGSLVVDNEQAADSVTDSLNGG